MSEFFRDHLNNVFQINETGSLLKLSFENGKWENFSDSSDFDVNCKTCGERFLNNAELYIYLKKSRNMELSKGRTIFGKNFDFLNNGGQIYCIDENNNEYICYKTYLTSVEKGTVNREWEKIAPEIVFKKINNIDSVSVEKFENYVIENHYLKDFLKKIKDNISEEFFNEFYALYSYITESRKVFMEHKDKKYEKIIFGERFLFYRDVFGRMYARDENINEYICNETYMIPIRKNTIKKDFISIYRYNALDYIKLYFEHKKNPDKLEISFIDTYVNKNNELCGVTEDGRKYYVSSDTGNFERIKNDNFIKYFLFHIFHNGWKKCSKIEAVKLRAKQLEEYKGIISLDRYLEKCRKSDVKNCCKTFGNDLKFYKNSFGRVFAKDGFHKEYVCEKDYIILLKNKGNIDYVWEPVKSCQVTYFIKVYIDMMNEICEKNKNLKEMRNYIRYSENFEFERTGSFFGCNFRFFINFVGSIFAKDENGSEYLCTKNYMVHIDKGIIDEENWDGILESEVIKYL